MSKFYSVLPTIKYTMLKYSRSKDKFSSYFGMGFEAGFDVTSISDKRFFPIPNIEFLWGKEKENKPGFSQFSINLLPAVGVAILSAYAGAESGSGAAAAAVVGAISSISMFSYTVGF